MSSLGYDIKERNIIFNSNFARLNYPVLIQIMEQYRSLSTLDVEKNFEHGQFAYLDRSIIQEILKACRREWEIIKTRGGDYKVRILPERLENCMICNTKIKNVFSIRNTDNQIELNVGSECIKNYEIGQDRAKDFKKKYAEQVKAQERITYATNLKKEYPTLADKLRQYQYYLNSNQYALPTSIEMDFEDTYAKLRAAQNNYLDSGDRTQFDSIKCLLFQLSEKLELNSVFFIRQVNNPWALTTVMKRSIISRESKECEDLCESCTITGENLFCITNDELCKEVITKLTPIVSSLGFKIIPAKTTYSKVAAEVTIHDQRLVFLIPYEQFTKTYGTLVFQSTSVSINAIDYLKKNSFIVHETSFQFSLLLLSSFFPSGVGFYKSNDNESIEIIGSQAFLVFYKSSGSPTEKFITISVPDVIRKLFPSYIRSEKDPIIKWVDERRESKGLPLADIHDTIKSYNYYSSESRFR